MSFFKRAKQKGFCWQCILVFSGRGRLWWMLSHLRFFKLAEEEDEIGMGRDYLSTHLPSNELLTCLTNHFMTEKVEEARRELLD